MTLGAEQQPFVRAVAAILIAGLAFGVAASSPPTSAIEQLQRMAAAVNELSFEGTLVYLHQNRLETLYIYHTVEGDRAHERLVSMTGPVRSVTREEDEVTCILPNSHPISVKRGTVAHDLLRSRAMNLEVLDGHYRLHSLGVARVAGRQTDVVGIIPNDTLRYGYRFYLDRETGLPLKTDLMGSDSEPIEQVMFTTVKLNSRPVPIEPAASAAPPAVVADSSSSPWRFDDLPTGFDLMMYQVADADGDTEVEHFLLSDGLASVSVYVEPDDGDGLDGTTHIGAIHAIGGQVAGHRVTVVGEVPAATVETVLAGIRHTGADVP